MNRINVGSGTQWEEKVGYSRAVKIGNIIEISGTVATDNSGELIGKDDSYLQTKFILMKTENTLKQLGASFENVIRTRIFCTNIADWEAIGKAHGEVFSEIKPVTTMVEVHKLIHEDYKVEIEFSAIINN